MKKILVFSFIVFSSFFLFCSNTLADTFNIEVDSSHFDYFNDDFYTFRDLLINKCSEDNSYYYIFYNTSSKRLESYVFSSAYSLVKDRYYSSKNNFHIIYGSSSYKKYYLSSGSLGLSGSGSGYQLYMIYDYSSSNSSFNYYLLLDSNNDNIFFESMYGNNINLTYKTISYSISNRDKFPTLYEIYEKSLSISDPHLEEKKVLSDFYTLVIDKLLYLTNFIVSNYIYLSIICVFLLIYIFSLIKRRFL